MPMLEYAEFAAAVVRGERLPTSTNCEWTVNIAHEENGETLELLQIVQLLQKMQQSPGYYPYLQ